MKRIPANQVKQRTKRLTDLFNSYDPYANRIGKKYTALVTDISHDKNFYVGHNKFYEQILLPMQKNLLGKSVRVQIKSVTKFSMLGEILDTEEKWQACSTNTENVHDKIAKTSLESTETNGLTTNASNHWNAEDNKNAAFLYALIALFLAIIYRYTWKFLNEMK